jgi:tRNA pseudouridine synthase 10
MAESVAAPDTAMAVCTTCADRIRGWYGDIVPASAVLPEGLAPESDDVCAACLGVLQHAEGILAAAATAGVRASPFLDCPAVSVVVSIPRAVSFTMASVCWRLLAAQGRVVDGSGTSASEAAAAVALASADPSAEGSADVGHGAAAGHESNIVAGRGDVVPASLCQFGRDAAVTRVMAAFAVALGISSAGSATTAHGSEDEKRGRDEDAPAGTRFGMVRRFGKSDDEDTIVVDLSSDVSCHDKGGDRPPVTAIVARRTFGTDGETASRLSGSALAAALCRLPEEQQGNKAGAAFTWGLVESAIVPAHGQDWRAGRVLRCCPISHVWRTSVFLFGRYRKMMRDVPQSPWFIDKKRVGRFSLQEVIAEQALPLFYDQDTLESTGDGSITLNGTFRGGKKNPPPKAAVEDQILGANLYKFMSAGREDVDVRMLGSGRPFAFEIKSPHRVSAIGAAELDAVEAAVNDGGEDVEVEGLALIKSRNVATTLHAMSQEKRKHYRCVCYCSRPLKSDADAGLAALRAIRDLEVHQQTPLRVLHRRSQMNRPKTVHSASVRRVADQWLVLDLETQAGAYIKEFCHGDLGRTRPALGDILDATTDIVQLDVVGVAVDPAVRAVVDRMIALKSSSATWGDDSVSAF